jgi:choline dehydrogenase-like flavoprotein
LFCCCEKECALVPTLTQYDVIIVGSGAGGGMSAWVLTQAGLKVLMLEAGRDYDAVAESSMFNTPAQAPLRGEATSDKPFGYYDATVDGGWSVPDEPYTVAHGSEFLWWRPRMLGGRTNHWGRIALRFGPYDFKPYSRDGLGFDWPITYDDLAPWYDRVERLIGVTGRAERIENLPDSPAGCHLPPPALRANEIFMERGFASMGVKTAAMRMAVLTQPLNGRPACFYATPCGYGCSIRANFQSTTVLLPAAIATGNLSIRTNALVHRVELNAGGNAKGVVFVDRKTGQRHEARAKAVVLSAGAAESARILLNSRATGFADGLANSSGLVGRYLMDTVGTGTLAQFPALEGLPAANEDGISNAHLFVPWWGHAQRARKELDFPRGYHIEPWGGKLLPDLGLNGVTDNLTMPYGAALRDEARRKYGSTLYFMGRGEMIPNQNCYCDLDPDVTDKWGAPVLRFHWKWSEHEIRQAGHMRKTFLEFVDRMGGKPLSGMELDGNKAISKGGEIIHEVGTCRMGSAANNSVVNQFGQSWDIKNLFIMDGAVMVSSPDKNPTLSILALSWRSSAFLAEEARKGNL